jgi:PAS domain S-box-containing protein
MLLRAEHAVAHVLASADGEDDAHPRFLAAIGDALGWDVGALWAPAPDDPTSLRCVHVWQAPGTAADAFVGATRELVLAPGDGLPGRVWHTGQPSWVADVTADPRLPRAAAATACGLRSAFGVPVPGTAGMLGAIEFFSVHQRAPDDDLLSTMTSLGSRIGHFVERCRAQQAVRESEARKTAILDAAFDCVVTMDERGHIVEVNAATERTFGYTAAEMVGRDLAELMIPPRLRAAHREGLARYVATGASRIVGHPVELEAMRADGSEFPVELAVTRPQLPGPPLFCGYLRDVTARHESERALRRLATEQAALRRVATAVAAEVDHERLFGIVTEEVGRLLDAQTANMVRFLDEGKAAVVGGWSEEGVANVAPGSTVVLDGNTVAAKVWHTGRPARVDSYEGLTGTMAEALRRLGFRSAVAAPVKLERRLWGAVIVSTVHPEPFPPGAEQRIADFAELAAQAIANAEARQELAASRARIVAAGDAERRRLERNLHDGAQQRLVALSLSVRLAARRVDGDPDLRAALDAASDELAVALDELRELARGLHPAILSDHGLLAALEALATRAPVPVDVDVQVGEPLPRPVEAAAYYLVAEALTNVAKYAGASSAHVHVTHDDGMARVEVSDDGAGGADRERGSGLRGLTDRIEALGGRLEVISPVGAGTTLRAAIPAP